LGFSDKALENTCSPEVMTRVVLDANVLVSGDRHLLEIQEYQGIPILTPCAFLTILGQQPPPSEQ
jgi:hypothetical protein